MLSGALDQDFHRKHLDLIATLFVDGQVGHRDDFSGIDAIRKGIGFDFHLQAFGDFGNIDFIDLNSGFEAGKIRQLNQGEARPGLITYLKFIPAVTISGNDGNTGRRRFQHQQIQGLIGFPQALSVLFNRQVLLFYFFVLDANGVVDLLLGPSQGDVGFFQVEFNLLLANIGFITS
ncbi:MAG: hypothetical protein BWY72_02000 [Bacteroidetes bacterium ADurb.Bin416]|nr:MAG: hypothetical protein BWY72_02000 [Bacteroidetes bacterium ADurb.Bin416]